MKPYEASTVWAGIMLGILIILIALGEYTTRGYFALGTSTILLVLSPILLRYWYKSEKTDYLFKKYSYREDKRHE